MEKQRSGRVRNLTVDREKLPSAESNLQPDVFEVPPGAELAKRISS